MSVAKERFKVIPERFVATYDIPDHLVTAGRYEAERFARYVIHNRRGVNAPPAYARFAHADHTTLCDMVDGFFDFTTGRQTYLIGGSLLGKITHIRDDEARARIAHAVGIEVLTRVARQPGPDGGRPFTVYTLTVPRAWREDWQGRKPGPVSDTGPVLLAVSDDDTDGAAVAVVKPRAASVQDSQQAKARALWG